ncbi:MAG: hypothetical protein PHD95_05565 [Candidatus ainarchaeum sp.]|nr:hypothetical protein [Candidatus ainarchaeum sp.]
MLEPKREKPKGALSSRLRQITARHSGTPELGPNLVLESQLHLIDRLTRKLPEQEQQKARQLVANSILIEHAAHFWKIPTKSAKGLFRILAEYVPIVTETTANDLPNVVATAVRDKGQRLKVALEREITHFETLDPNSEIEISRAMLPVIQAINNSALASIIGSKKLDTFNRARERTAKLIIKKNQRRG